MNLTVLESLHFAYGTRNNLDALCTERNFDGGVIWCYSEKTAVPNQQLAVLKKKIRYNEGVPADFENAHCRPCHIILVDLFNYSYSKEVCDLFTNAAITEISA